MHSLLNLRGHYARALASMALACLAATTGAAAPLPAPLPTPAPMSVVAKAASTVPSSIGHVFVIVLENKSYTETFSSPDAPFLTQTMPAEGALLEYYYAIGHASLDNYIAMISGQAPNISTQADCLIYHDFVTSQPLNKNGQALGKGCVYPTQVPSLPDQLRAAHISWKGYMEDMGADPSRESATCGHPPLNHIDNTQGATATDQYATRHNPFMYFHSVIDDQAYCDAHVVNMENTLPTDLQSVGTTPQFSFITPDLCSDGHDNSCADGETGGLVGINRFLSQWVPVIQNSPAFKQDGLLIVLFDEADGSGDENYDRCCGEKHSIHQNTPLPPGETGAGGGRVGAVMLSPFIKPGTVSTLSYNHYALLRSVEEIFGLPYLGYAAAGADADGPNCDHNRQPCAFDNDIYTQQMPVFPARVR